MSPVFTVVVPVYNEAGFIPTALPMLVAAVDDVGVPYRVLLIENGSTDSTAETARRVATGPEIEVISIEEADYGRAMREGFRLARSEWVVNFDIDYFSAGFLRAVLEQPDDVDIVIASKRDPGSDDRRPFIRRLATRVFNLLLRTILDSRVTDTHGMKGFRSDLVRNLEPDVISNQDLFDTELVIRAERAGYRIVEVPVMVEEMRLARSSLIKRAPRTVAGLFTIRKLLKNRPI